MRAFILLILALIFASLVCGLLSGCVTRIEGRVVNVSISPATRLHVQASPLP